MLRVFMANEAGGGKSRKETVKPWDSQHTPEGHPEAWGWWQHAPSARKKVATV